MTIAELLRDTSRRLAELGIVRPTLVIDRRRAEANIDMIADRGREANVPVRPHVKTHQSAAIAAWQRAAGATSITVSSLEMAAYFADHGWDDITLAVLVNPRQRDEIAALADRVRLGVLVDRPEVVTEIAGLSRQTLRVWIEVDVGHGRTGVPWDVPGRLRETAAAIAAAPGLVPAGLLTHAGQSYDTRSPRDAAAVFQDARERMQRARAVLVFADVEPGPISVGDTPGCVSAADWQGVDEVRPGNYVFFDLMQLYGGICPASRLACAVACPVIAVYPDEGRVVVHGGAVHFSKERLEDSRQSWYGEVMTLTGIGFGPLIRDLRLSRLSQEHGVLDAISPDGLAMAAALRPGDLLLLAPVHSCLTCEQFGSYLTTDGEPLERWRRR